NAHAIIPAPVTKGAPLPEPRLGSSTTLLNSAAEESSSVVETAVPGNMATVGTGSPVRAISPDTSPLRFRSPPSSLPDNSYAAGAPTTAVPIAAAATTGQPGTRSVGHGTDPIAIITALSEWNGPPGGRNA
ncbi:MAG: hypothetical protein Q9218_008285, partial [Villophora microphyllina]